MQKHQIKIFEGTPEQFYAIMGKYFAEPHYRKQMPYMLNKPTHTWIIALENERIIGFGAVNFMKNKIVFESSFVEQEYRNTGIWKDINLARFKIAENTGLPIEVITKEEHLKKYWIDNGFNVFKQNGRYFYLRKVDKK